MSGTETPAVTPDEVRAIEADCSRVLLRLFLALDERRYDDVAASFLENGMWHRRGQALSGPGEVRRAMAERPATARVRHVITNLVVTPRGPDVADFILYLSAYTHDGPVDAAPPVPATLWMLFVVTGTMASSDGAWRIQEMTMQREFSF
ncbi:MAG TPA: nuclear transport factor 2 family protein [Hyphomicrobiales bacterium]|nr:nuclear transport factor 2 family protein [Hyphomicrobiales bacterium]